MKQIALSEIKDDLSKYLRLAETPRFKAMKTSTIQFDELRRLLRDLGFSEIREAAGWRFEHSPSGAVFLFSALFIG